MSFLFDGIFDVLILICKGIMFLFSGDLWVDLMVPGAQAKMGMEDPKFDYLSWAGETTGPFDAAFPGMITLRDIIKGMGYMFATMLFVFGLFRAIMPDTPNSKATHPATLTGRYFLAVVTTTFSYGILYYIQYPMHQVCLTMKEMAAGGQNGLRESPTASFRGNDTEGRINELLPDDIFSPEGIVNNSAGLARLATGDNWAGDIGIIPTALCCVLLLVMTFFFIRLVLEAIERYVVCGFLFYMAPLGFSMLASEGTSNTTKSYFQMMIGQYLVITFNLLVIYVFFGAIQVLGNNGEAGGALLDVCLLIAWLKLGTKLDEMMRTLGFSVAQTGAGLGREMIGTAMTIAGMATMAGRTISTIRNAPMRAAQKAEAAANLERARERDAFNNAAMENMRKNFGGEEPRNVRKDADGKYANPFTQNSVHGPNGEMVTQEALNHIDPRKDTPYSGTKADMPGDVAQFYGSALRNTLDDKTIDMSGGAGSFTAVGIDGNEVQGALKGTPQADALLANENAHEYGDVVVSGDPNSVTMQRITGTDQFEAQLNNQGNVSNVTRNEDGTLSYITKDKAGNNIQCKAYMPTRMHNNKLEEDISEWKSQGGSVLQGCKSVTVNGRTERISVAYFNAASR